MKFLRAPVGVGSAPRAVSGFALPVPLLLTILATLVGESTCRSRKMAIISARPGLLGG